MSDVARRRADATVFPVLAGASVCHLLNDLSQSLFMAAYPIFKGGFDLSFAQIGLLTLVYQLTASLLQPLVGLYTDRRPQPYSLPFGMGVTMVALIVLAFAASYPMLLAAAALLGVGSSIFHPESSRLARLASGGAHGMAQSVFQIGGNLGSALGPLSVALFVVPHGQSSLAWFALAALGGMIILTFLGRWYRDNGHARPAHRGAVVHPDLSRRQVGGAFAVLLCLMVSKWFYLATFTSYYVFYLMDRFGLHEGEAQVYLFVYLAAVAAGTLIGGPIGDRIGRKAVIWISILGVLPFSLVLPYVGLWATAGLSVVIGILIASAFPAIVVYAQELLPGRVGMVSGLIFGVAFGLGGIGAAVLGVLADATSIDFVYRACAFLPAFGLLAAFLPDVERRRRRAAG